MGSSDIRFKAEMVLDGKEITQAYLDQQDASELLKVGLQSSSQKDISLCVITGVLVYIYYLGEM